jgi:BolA protein
MSLKHEIRSKLHSLSPNILELEDVSYKHKGHSGYNPEGGSHFNLYIVSDKFENMSHLKRHRLIKSLLEEEFKTIHALSIEAKTNEETKSMQQ